MEPHDNNLNNNKQKKKTKNKIDKQAKHFRIQDSGRNQFKLSVTIYDPTTDLISGREFFDVVVFYTH